MDSYSIATVGCSASSVMAESQARLTGRCERDKTTDRTCRVLQSV